MHSFLPLGIRTRVYGRKFFGKTVSKKVGKIWNFDNKKQELNNMFVKTNQEGLGLLLVVWHSAEFSQNI